MGTQNLLMILLLLTSLLAVFQANSNCRRPTEEDPVSLCSSCSKSHAGIRWTVHQSTISKYPFGAYSIDIHFHCSDGETTTTQDMCFDGDLFPGLTFLSNPTAWRWHILGRRFSTGTECQFTARIKNGFYQKILDLSTSCVIGDKEDQMMPATCTESNQQAGCSCQCSEGFATDNDIRSFLSCINIDECSEGTHHCGDVSNCVDTEGSYYCKGELSPTPTGRGVVTSTLIAPMYTPVPKYRPINPMNAGIISPTSSIIPTKPLSEPLADPMCMTTMSTVTTCSIATSTVTHCFSQSV